MATQPQKYSGKNSLNNRVEVDFTKRTVKFHPVKGKIRKENIKKILLINTLIAYALIGLLAILTPTTIIGEILKETTEIEKEQINYYETLAAITWITSTIIATTTIMIKSTNKKWMEERYPKINATIAKATEETEKITIRPRQTYKNMIIIPNFKNIELKYKLTGDFKKIKKITINNTRSDTNWYCIFEFKKPLKKGYAQITYT